MFRLNFAPHSGMFRHSAGEDLCDQVRFAHDQGFTAWEENGIAELPVSHQEQFSRVMSDLGMRMGVFVVNLKSAWSANLTTGTQSAIDCFVGECREAVEVAKRVNATWMTVVPGMLDPKLDMGYQSANVIEALRRGAEIMEPHGLTLVIEPLNPFVDHPGLFLTRIPQAFQICRSVDSPSCKILFDIYHQQITEGNLIGNIELAWREIAYFQMGDHPGRKEPTTGEINYRSIFRHIAEKGYCGIMGMEHGISRPGQEGEAAMVRAYRDCDCPDVD